MKRFMTVAAIVLLAAGCEFFGTDDQVSGVQNLLKVQLSGVNEQLNGSRVLYSVVPPEGDPAAGMILAGADFYLYNGSGEGTACSWDSVNNWYLGGQYHSFSNREPVDLYLMVDKNGNYSSTGSPDYGDYTYEEKRIVIDGLTTVHVSGSDLQVYTNGSGGSPDNTLYVSLSGFSAAWEGKSVFFGVLAPDQTKLAGGSFQLSGTESGGYAKKIDIVTGGTLSENYLFNDGEQVLIYFMVDVNDTNLQFIPGVTPEPGYGDYSTPAVTKAVSGATVHSFTAADLTQQTKCQVRVKLTGISKPDGTVVQLIAGGNTLKPADAGFVPLGTNQLTVTGGEADGFLMYQQSAAIADYGSIVSLHVIIKSNGNTAAYSLETGDRYAGYEFTSPFMNTMDGDFQFDITDSQIYYVK